MYVYKERIFLMLKWIWQLIDKSTNDAFILLFFLIHEMKIGDSQSSETELDDTQKWNQSKIQP